MNTLTTAERQRLRDKIRADALNEAAQVGVSLTCRWARDGLARGNHERCVGCLCECHNEEPS